MGRDATEMKKRQQRGSHPDFPPTLWRQRKAWLARRLYKKRLGWRIKRKLVGAKRIPRETLL